MLSGTPGGSDTDAQQQTKPTKKAKRMKKKQKRKKEKRNKQKRKLAQMEESSMPKKRARSSPSAQPFSEDEFNEMVHKYINSAGCDGLTDQYIIEKLETNPAIAARFAAADTGFGKQAHRVYNLAKVFLEHV